MKDVNPTVLAETLREHADEKLAKDLRDWMIYGAPNDVREIFTKYVKKMEERDEAERARREEIRNEYQSMMIWFRVFSWLIVVGVVVFSAYQIYELFTMTPGCMR